MGHSRGTGLVVAAVSFLTGAVASAIGIFVLWAPVVDYMESEVTSGAAASAMESLRAVQALNSGNSDDALSWLRLSIRRNALLLGEWVESSPRDIDQIPAKTNVQILHNIAVYDAEMEFFSRDRGSDEFFDLLARYSMQSNDQ